MGREELDGEIRLGADLDAERSPPERGHADQVTPPVHTRDGWQAPNWKVDEILACLDGQLGEEPDPDAARVGVQ
jgi:hypothetical protein